MARLPVPGSDDGTWGTILNEFLGVEHNSDGTLKTSGSLANKANTSTTISAGTGLSGGGDLSANRTLSVSYGTSSGTAAQGNDSRITGAVQSTLADAKGDLLVATAADTIVRLPVGSNNQVLTADSTQASGVKWAAASGGSSVSPLLTGMGLVGITADPLGFVGTAAPNQADHLIVLIAVPSGAQITGAKVAIETAGTYSATATPAQVRFWDFDGALLGTTPDDPGMWLTAGSRTATLATPFTAPSNGLLYVGVSFGGFSGVVTPAAASSYAAGPTLKGFLGGKRFNFFGNSGSGMPSSFDPTTYGSGTTWVPLIGVTGS